jgi:hypothetical protein
MEPEETIKKWDELLFDVRRSIRYHSKRADWFEFCCKFTTTFAIFVSAGAITALLNKVEWASITASALVAFFSIVSLVFGWSQREHLHTDLKRKFAELEKAMVKCENPDGKILAEMTAERLSIEAYEPNPIDVLNIICHNDLCIAQGSGKIYKVGWFRYMFCHFNPSLKNPEVEREIGVALG